MTPPSSANWPRSSTPPILPTALPPPTIPTEDVLSIDQPLPDVDDELIESDSDTNLDVQMDFTDVPEPTSLTLLSTLALTILPRRKRQPSF